MIRRAILLFPLLATLSVHADFWPEFRGPDKNGHAGSADVPLTWSASQNVRWKVPVDGTAWSSPVIAEGRVFVSTAVVDGEDLSLEARAYDLADGKEIWKTVLFKKKADKIHKKNSHASPTPIFEDGQLYLHFGHHGTACVNALDGKEVWSFDDLDFDPVHGTGGSPAISGDMLIFSCDGAKDAFVMALNKNNGRVAWKTPRDVEVQRPFSFSTPLIAELDGKIQAVIPGSGAVVGYDPKNGKEIWRFGYGEGYSVVPRPLLHDGRLFVCSGFNQATLFAIRASELSGDVTESHLVWSEDKTIPKESSPIIAEGLLFVNDDKGILTCFDPATGEKHYSVRLNGEGGFSSSPVYASGHLFFHNGEGITTVVKPGKTYEMAAENDIEEYGLSSFAVVTDGFVVRTDGSLIRIGR